jgi:putative redox protein
MTSTLRPKSTTAIFHLHSTGTGVSQVIAQEGSKHQIHVDAAPAFGGNDEYPSPIAYALSALISCSQVTSQLVAKDLGVNLNGFEFDIKAELDTAVLVQGSLDGNANFERIEIQAVVDTDSSTEEFERLRVETERRCPIYQLYLRSGVAITNHWSIRQPAEV